MLTIELEIERIDYENSVGNLLPTLVRGDTAGPEAGLAEKLLVRLGKDAVPLSKKLLSYLDVDTRDRLLIWLLQCHQRETLETLNSHLAEALGGNMVMIGGLAAEDLPGTRLKLTALQVSVDYDALLDSPALSGVLPGAARLALRLLSPQALEKQGIGLLGTEPVKTKVLSFLTDGLEQAGLILTLQDMQISGETAIPLSDGSADAALPPELEDALLDALVAWMKDTV